LMLRRNSVSGAGQKLLAFRKRWPLIP